MYVRLLFTSIRPSISDRKDVKTETKDAESVDSLNKHYFLFILVL